MKAKNNKEVKKSVIRFTYYLVGTIFLAVCIFSGFMKTSSVEISKILAKTQEYDYIQMRQIDLTESMDTIYFYTSLLNSDPKINNSLMYNVISNRKIHFQKGTETMEEKDCRLYKKIAPQLNTFLATKDSIRLATSEEETVRMDLLRCINDNKKTARKLAIGGLTYDKN